MIKICCPFSICVQVLVMVKFSQFVTTFLWADHCYHWFMVRGGACAAWVPQLEKKTKNDLVKQTFFTLTKKDHFVDTRGHFLYNYWNSSNIFPILCLYICWAKSWGNGMSTDHHKGILWRLSITLEAKQLLSPYREEQCKRLLSSPASMDGCLVFTHTSAICLHFQYSVPR